MKVLLLLALTLAPFTAFAGGELDNETKNAKRIAAQYLPQTLVVKVDAAGAVSVLHSNDALVAGANTLLDDSKFIPMKNTDSMKELDKDSSTSGWYFWWYNQSYNYPAYNYYGYSYYYQPYYNYSYNGCNYYWYRWYY